MSEITIEQVMDLAVEHHKAGRISEAKTIYQQILVRQPNHADALHLLGIITAQEGRHQLGVELISRAIAINPTAGMYYNNLGSVLILMGQLDQAINAYRTAVKFKPDYAEAYNKLGVALKDKGQIDEAIAACREAIRIKSDFVEAYNDLGNALQAQGKFDQAIAAYREALRRQPNYAEVWNNLGNVLQVQGHLEEAVEAYRSALRLKPDWVEIQNNLGNTLKDQGQLDTAISAFRTACAQKPDMIQAHNNLIYALHYHPDFDAMAIHQEQQRWNQQHAAPLKKFIMPHTNPDSPQDDSERRLKIGYVSSDFREHVVGWNLLPLFQEHDHKFFEIFCYSSVVHPDTVTQRLRSLADKWRNIVGVSDQQAAQMIREDKIDILVDLAVHTAYNRLLLFAHKPAPIQVTWLGYPGSTGMDAIDYRLSDPYLDPPDTDLSVYSEQTVRLSHTYWCYQPGGAVPDVLPPSALTAGFVTFGCLNKFAKVSPPVLDSWTQILKAVPHSRLILHCNLGTHRPQLIERFTRTGIAPERIELVGKQPWLQYISTYNRIDIALDPFPYGGGITTCDALYMGVPVVSLSGCTAVGRAGRSILSNADLPDLIASTSKQYQTIATKLADDLPRLTELHKTLRQRMLSSPLMDAKSFACDIESAYRGMWRNWCAVK
jgi:protein O-GlcNAc transferase